MTEQPGVKNMPMHITTPFITGGGGVHTWAANTALE
jgi:hypothetical protein